ACPLKLGDGLVFDEGDPQQEEQGGSVFDLLDASGRKSLGAAGEADARSSGKPLPRVTVEFRAGQLDAGRLQPGQLVWKTKDHALEARLRATYEGLAGSAMRSLPVSARVSGKIGSALNLTLRDDAGFEVCALTNMALSAASKRPLTVDDIAAGLGQLGDNALSLDSLDTTGLDIAQ
ncbi:DUF3656 domain-containing protein, partial [Haematococcus lacustris]